MFWFISVLNTHKRRDAKRETCTYMNAKRGTHTTNGPDGCLVVCDASPLVFDSSNKAHDIAIRHVFGYRPIDHVRLRLTWSWLSNYEDATTVSDEIVFMSFG